MRQPEGCARVLVSFALVFAAVPACSQAPPFAFDTAGGDAWTFDKAITGTVLDGQCDEVVLSAPQTTVVTRPRDGHVAAHVTLDPGDNRIEAQCRKDGAANAPPVSQNWYARLRDVPTALVDVAVSDDGILLDAARSQKAPVRAVPIVHYEWRAHPGNPDALTGLPAAGAKIALRSPNRDGDYRVDLEVSDASARSDKSGAVFRVRNGKAQTVDLAYEHPAWTDDAVIYGVIPKLFGRGGLADVTAQLGRLAALGVNALWLSPVTSAPRGDFGYAVTDFFHVRPSLGGEVELRRLVEAAHARGMHVVLDLVANHVAIQHPYFQDTIARGRHSPYFDFFARSPTGEATHYFDWVNLENLNYGNPEVERLVIEAFAHWVRDFHIDGFRVDAAWGPRQRAPDFWPRWSAELKRINPDLLLIAEAPAGDPYYLSSGFDAAYDWTAQLGEWSWRAAFDDPARTAPLLRTAIQASPGRRVLRFLDNNDTGARFVTRQGLPRTRVAAAMLLTLPGLPAIYTGDEVGAAYMPYTDSDPISWDDPAHLQSWYTELISLRRRETALRSAAIRWLEVAPARNALAYVRGEPDQSERILVLLNYGPDATLMRFDASADVVRAGSAADLISGMSVSGDAFAFGIVLEGYGVRLLKLSGPL